MYQVKDSQDIHPTELDLFSTPPTQSTYDKIQWVDYHPVNPIKEDSPLEFVIPASGSQYINLNQTYLHIKLKVVKADGTDMEIDDKVAPINEVLHSLWSHVEILLQQKLINVSTTNYGYKSLMETLLSYDTNAKNTRLQSEGFFKDTSGVMDANDPLTGGNAGLAKRFNLVLTSKEVDFMGPLHADFFQQNRLLLNGVELQVKLWPSRSNFVLMTPSTTEKYKINITQARLQVCKITLMPTLSLAHANMLAESPAMYPYERTDLKTYNISKGNFSFRADDVYQGSIPSRLILGIVNSEAYNGSYQLNPYNFINANCSSVAIYLDDESVPAQPIKSNFGDGEFMEAYYSLFTALNKDTIDEGNGIEREDYDRGYTLYAFQILPTTSSMNGEMNQFPLLRRGNLKVDFHFREALEKNVTLIIMGKFPEMIQIDKARNVVL